MARRDAAEGYMVHVDRMYQRIQDRNEAARFEEAPDDGRRESFSVNCVVRVDNERRATYRCIGQVPDIDLPEQEGATWVCFDRENTEVVSLPTSDLRLVCGLQKNDPIWTRKGKDRVRFVFYRDPRRGPVVQTMNGQTLDPGQCEYDPTQAKRDAESSRILDT